MSDQAQNVTIYLETLRSILPMLKSQSDAQLSRRIGKEKLEDAAADIAGFIEASCDTTLQKNERLTLTAQVLKCLARYVEQTMKLPLTLKTLTDSTQLTSYAVNQDYPGYAESKLLRYTIVPLKSEMLSIR